jgi:hypothetical protein
MDILKVIEKLLNRDSILNLLENDIIEKFEVVDTPKNPKLLVIKMYLNTTKDELISTGESTPHVSETDAMKGKLWELYNLDPSWWQVYIIPAKILKPLVGKNYYNKILLFVVDKNDTHLFTEN